VRAIKPAIPRAEDRINTVCTTTDFEYVRYLWMLSRR